MANRLRPVVQLCLLVWCGSLASAQSNELVDRILGEDLLTAGSAAYLALAGASLVDVDVSPDEALASARERGWIADEFDATDPVRLGDFAYLIVGAFEIPSGLMFRFVPGPRYAARELAFREMVVGSSTPYRNLSGEEALGILGAVLDWQEAGS